MASIYRPTLQVIHGLRLKPIKDPCPFRSSNWQQSRCFRALTRPLSSLAQLLSTQAVRQMASGAAVTPGRNNQSYTNTNRRAMLIREKVPPACLMIVVSDFGAETASHRHRLVRVNVASLWIIIDWAGSTLATSHSFSGSGDHKCLTSSSGKCHPND